MFEAECREKKTEMWEIEREGGGERESYAVRYFI